MTLPGDFRGVSGVTVRLMSDGELSRLEVLRDLDQKRLTTAAAAQLLGLGRRQVFRLLKAYRTEGPTGLVSKRRGRHSNRRKAGAATESGAGDRPRVVLGFWSDLGGRKASCRRILVTAKGFRRRRFGSEEPDLLQPRDRRSRQARRILAEQGGKRLLEIAG